MEQGAICCSGKRKSGKDFVCNLLAKSFEEAGVKVVICGVSHPLKEEYAALNNIDAEQLKGDGPPKESFRKNMVLWGEEIRDIDSAYFCRKVVARAVSADILIVPDCRRRSDIRFFEKHYGNKLILIRIECSDEMRKLRGYQYVQGIDNEITECGLDDYEDWNFIIQNDELVSEGRIPENLKVNIKRVRDAVLRCL